LTARGIAATVAMKGQDSINRVDRKFEIGLTVYTFGFNDSTTACSRKQSSGSCIGVNDATVGFTAWKHNKSVIAVINSKQGSGSASQFGIGFSDAVAREELVMLVPESVTVTVFAVTGMYV